MCERTEASGLCAVCSTQAAVVQHCWHAHALSDAHMCMHAHATILPLSSERMQKHVHSGAGQLSLTWRRCCCIMLSSTAAVKPSHDSHCTRILNTQSNMIADAELTKQGIRISGNCAATSFMQHGSCTHSHVIQFDMPAVFVQQLQAWPINVQSVSKSHFGIENVYGTVPALLEHWGCPTFQMFPFLPLCPRAPPTCCTNTSPTAHKCTVDVATALLGCYMTG